jgi:hypothetical protein
MPQKNWEVTFHGRRNTKEQRDDCTGGGTILLADEDHKINFMSDRNENRSASNDRPDDMTGKGHDRQGIDKAPGEEASSDMENVVANTQKGKSKVDGDPSKEPDQPIDQQ